MIIDSKKLNTLLKRLRPAIHSNPVIPILEYVLVKDGKITATNLEITISTAIDTDQVLLLPFAQVLAITEVSEGELNITPELITCGKDRHKIPHGANVIDFPAIPVFDSALNCEVDKEFIQACINASLCRLKTSTGEVKETVSGIYAGRE